MARLAAKARCNYYPLPHREAELTRSCRTFPDELFSALDPCAGEGRAMAVITGSSNAARHGIELDANRAEGAAKVLDRVIQGDALSAHARVESFGMIFANPPLTQSLGSRETSDLKCSPGPTLPAGLRLPVFSSTSCLHSNWQGAPTYLPHFRDVPAFRVACAECVMYEQIVVFAVARSRRERDPTRDSEISFRRSHLMATARQYEA
jgi:hypothetical protein